MDRTVNRRPDPTSDRSRARWMWLVAAWCALFLSACAGGSGSSGFGPALLRENRAIDEALETDGCEVNEGLTICASGAESPKPAPTETPVPSDSPSVPTATSTPEFLGTATPTTSAPAATVSATMPFRETPTASPTPTEIPSGPNVGTNVGSEDTLPCQRDLPAADGCLFVFSFVPEGFPASAAYRVAVRMRNPDSDWEIQASINNNAPIVLSPDDGSVSFQIAVLVFLDDPTGIPSTVRLLADTGADYAFVTPVLTPVAAP